MDALRTGFRDYARDMRLNLGRYSRRRARRGSPAADAVALATAIAARNRACPRGRGWPRRQLERSSVEGARAAAAIMGMNNVYYRFLHLVEDEEYARLPARLRMNVIGNPGIDGSTSSCCRSRFPRSTAAACA